MRRSCILLLLLAALPVICGAVSAINGAQTKPVLATGNGAVLKDNNSGRLLLGLDKVEEDDVAGEERGLGSSLKKLLGIKERNPDFAKKDLKKALKDREFKRELYQKWDKYTIGEIKANLKHTDRNHPREYVLFYGYVNKYRKAAESVKRPEGKVKKTVELKLDEHKVRTFDDEGKYVDEIVRLDGPAA